MNRTRAISCSVTAGLVLALGVAVAPASTTPARHRCPAEHGVLASANVGKIWHRRHSIYGCTEVYGQAPKRRRLGPWTPPTKVAFDGYHVAWTVRMIAEGKATDRVWAADVQTGTRWMLAQKPNPGGADRPARETRVQRLVVRDTGVAWVTKRGDVVGALREPSDPLTVVGTLPAPPVVQKNLVLVGSWPAVSVTDLAASLRLTEGSGDGDECGGVNPYRLTVTPDASTGEAGVTWNGYWSRPNCG